MNKIKGAFGLLIIVVSHSVSKWAPTENSQYIVCLILLIIGSIITLKSELFSDFAQWISLREFVVNRYLKTPKKVNKYKNTIIYSFAGIIFLLVAWMIINLSENKIVPLIFLYYIIVICVFIISLTKQIQKPNEQKLEEGTGFHNAIDKELFVKVQKRQYVYVKPESGIASWKLFLPNQSIILTNKHYFVFDLNNFRVEETITKLFAESDDSYVNAWIMLNINKDDLEKFKELDEETLYLINDFSDGNIVSEFLRTERAEFESAIRDARHFYQMVRAYQINDPLNYFANRMNIYQAIQNFTDIANNFKKKVISDIATKMQTTYLVSRDLNLNIFNTNIVLSYVFDNRPFNGNIITEIDNMLTYLNQENKDIDVEMSKTLVNGLIEAIKVTGRPELVKILINKAEQALNKLNSYHSTGVPQHKPNHQEPPLEDLNMSVLHLPEDQDFELDDAVQDLIEFRSFPEYHTENAHINLEKFVRSNFFKTNTINYKKLSDYLIDDTKVLRFNGNGEVNVPSLKILIKKSIIKSS